MALAPRTVQNMPDCLRRLPITLLQPASITDTDDEMLAPELGVAHALAISLEVSGGLADGCGEFRRGCFQGA